jgi:hypothetical protein
MKPQSKKSKPRRIPARDPSGSDPLGRAAQIAKPYPEEADAVERVIDAVHARGHGRGEPHGARIADVLLTLSILITSLDRAPTLAERQMFAALDALCGVRPRSSPAAALA